MQVAKVGTDPQGTVDLIESGRSVIYGVVDEARVQLKNSALNSVTLILQECASARAMTH